jgi:Mitochondrial carrier protein
MSNDRLLGELAAGSCAGLVADSVTHPIDTLRARLMVQRDPPKAPAGEPMRAGSGSGAGAGGTYYRGTFHALTHVARHEGIRGFYRGFGAVAVSTVPAHALYFGGYEMSKRQLARVSSNGEDAPWVHFMSGMWAELCGSVIWTPQDVIKQRLQVQRAVGPGYPAGVPGADIHYRDSFHALRVILRQDGVPGLFKGFIPALATYGPFVGVYFTCYERFKVVAGGGAARRADGTRGDEELPFLAHLGGGFLSGAIASVVTTPMDVVKTRLQVEQKGHTAAYKGAADAVLRMWREEGAMSFTKGMSARTLWIAPSTAVTIAAYEYFKRVFGAQ